MAFCDDPKCWNPDHVPGVPAADNSGIVAEVNAQFRKYEAEIRRLNLQILEATKKERERCAKIAESSWNYHLDEINAKTHATGIAKAIRSDP